ncbi:MAG: hypothetical protein H6926_01055 [Chromatiales bacterium]|nr:hypothetical protein [Chromatiales bacterium]
MALPVRLNYGSIQQEHNRSAQKEFARMPGVLDVAPDGYGRKTIQSRD